MKNSIRVLLVSVNLLMLGVAGFVVFATVSRNHALSWLLLQYQGQVMLSTSDCKQLSADLQSLDPGRIASWKMYFDRAAKGQIVSGRAALTPQQLIEFYSAEYRMRERPGRSNYFGALVAALDRKRQVGGLTVADLLDYLGTPDRTSNSPVGRVLVYNFTSAGGESATGVVEATSNIVSDINIISSARGGETPK